VTGGTGGLRRCAAVPPRVQAGEPAGRHLEGPLPSAARRRARDPAALLPGEPARLGARADVLITDRQPHPTAALRAGAWVHREES